MMDDAADVTNSESPAPSGPLSPVTAPVASVLILGREPRPAPDAILLSDKLAAAGLSSYYLGGVEGRHDRGRIRSEVQQLRGSIPHPLLIAGIGSAAAVAGWVMAEAELAGALGLDARMGAASLSLRHSAPVLLLTTPEASRADRNRTRTTKVVTGASARTLRMRQGGDATVGRLDDWRRAASSGAWEPERSAMPKKVAAVASAAAVVAGGVLVAPRLAGQKVSASQRSGDGAAAAVPTTELSGIKLTGNKVGARHRRGDRGFGLIMPHATGSQGLIDQKGVKFFVNTNITFSTSSSASGAMSEASFTHATNATTMNGGTVTSTLNDAYDGYSTLCLSLNNTVAACQTGNANFAIYNKNGPATKESGSCQQVDLPTQTVAADGLELSRKVYIPTDDSFERTLNYFTNPTASSVTATAVIANNLGSDSNTVITGTSSGGASPTTADNWVTTFQNYSGTTSSDPRLGHVLEGPGASVPLAGSHFVNGDDNPYWGWTFTVQPGQTVILANYGVVDQSKAASAADSARLDALPSTALECMSQSEVGELANFRAEQVGPPPDFSGFPAPPTATTTTTANPPPTTTTTMPTPTAPSGPATCPPGNDRFVCQVYMDLLGRMPDASGLSHWTGELSAGTSRTAVVRGIESTPEYLTDLVGSWYSEYLGRRPSGNEGAVFVAALQGGASERSMQAAVMASDEYFSVQGHGTNQGWLSASYQDLLGRPVDAAGQSHWLGLLAAGQSRQQVAAGIMASAEYRDRFVSSLFGQFLRRAASSSDVQIFVTEMGSDGAESQVRSQIVGSTEYFSDFSGS